MTDFILAGSRVAALVLLLVTPVVARAAEPVDAAAIEAAVAETMAANDLKAVIAGVAVAGEPVFLKAWGNSMTGVPATRDMHFRNGAIAIAYIGTVLLQLEEKGALALGDPLAKWFPEYPNADRVTLEMLMNGTSGYPDYVNMDVLPLYADPFRQWTPDELIAIGLGQKLKCEPGACWSYAHTNFVILGKVIEKATGTSLADLIRGGILEPLGLKNTVSDQTATIPEPVLHAFDRERGTYEESTFWDPSWTMARGAVMTSTIADVLVSAAAIGEGKLLSPDSHRKQMAPATAKFPPWNDKQWYGLGVFVIDGWVVQNPSFAGYAATMAYLPSRKLAIAVTATVGPKASPDENYSTTVLKAIAAKLAPEAPL